MQPFMRVIVSVSLVRVLILLAIVCVAAMEVGSDFDKRLGLFDVNGNKLIEQVNKNLTLDIQNILRHSGRKL